MFSVIDTSRKNEYMSFTHLGVVKNFEEQPVDDETKSWSGAKESYRLTDKNGKTKLDVELDITEEHADYFNNTFPKAIAKVKELAEE